MAVRVGIGCSLPVPTDRADAGPGASESRSRRLHQYDKDSRATRGGGHAASTLPAASNGSSGPTGTGGYGHPVTAYHVIDGPPDLDLVSDPDTPGAVHPEVLTSGQTGGRRSPMVILRSDGYRVNAPQPGKHLRPRPPAKSILAMPLTTSAWALGTDRAPDGSHRARG
jgi:hypothetical protein